MNARSSVLVREVPKRSLSARDHMRHVVVVLVLNSFDSEHGSIAQTERRVARKGAQSPLGSNSPPSRSPVARRTLPRLWYASRSLQYGRVPSFARSHDDETNTGGENGYAYRCHQPAG